MSNFKYKYLKYKLKLKDLEQEGGENEYHAGVKNDEEEYHSTSSSDEVVPTPVQDGGTLVDTISFPEYLEIETEQEGGENEYFPSDSESDEELFHFGGRSASHSEQVNRFINDYKDVIKFTGKILPGSILKPAFSNDPTESQFKAQGSFTDDEVVYIKVIRKSSFHSKSHPLVVFQRGKKGNFFGITREELKMDQIRSGENIIVLSINSYTKATGPVPVGSIERSMKGSKQILELKNVFTEASSYFQSIKLQLKSIKVYDLDQLRELSTTFEDLKNFTYIDETGMPIIPENTSNMPSNTTTAPGPVPVNNSQVEQTQVSSNMGPNTTAPKSVPVDNTQVRQKVFSQNDERNCRDDPGQFRNCIHKIDYCIERNFGSNLEECDVNYVIEKLNILDKDANLRNDLSSYLEYLKVIDKKLSLIPDSNLKKDGLNFRYNKHSNLYLAERANMLR